jgi:TPR repeat protein
MRQLLIIVALLFAHTAVAGDYEDGWAAYERKDYATAFSKFRSAALQGSAAAQYNLGLMYDEGLGVAQDYREAVRWYQLAAQQGNANAQYNLGIMYKDGQGITQDYTEAVRWYQLAAKQGKDKAQYNLGVMYEKGKGVAQDYKEAISSKTRTCSSTKQSWLNVWTWTRRFTRPYKSTYVVQHCGCEWGRKECQE